MMVLPFSSPGPILADFGITQIRWYGLMTALGCLTSIYVAANVLKTRSTVAERINSRLRRTNDRSVPCVHEDHEDDENAEVGVRQQCQEISFDDFSNFGLVAVVTGIIGARLWFVLLNISYFWQHPLESYQIWLGGQSIQGGLIGASLGTFIYCRFFQFKSYSLQLSALAVTAPLGQAIGRWGNFFNEEAYGTVTNLPWGLYISHTGKYHHPTFLYEMIWNLISFSILFTNHKKLTNKACIGLYLILYSAGRILIEQLRTDSLYIGFIKAATLISLSSITLGAFLIFNKTKSL